MKNIILFRIDPILSFISCFSNLFAYKNLKLKLGECI
jgi:hypothetical protein